VDFKTVKPWGAKPPAPYDSWPVQLAAYALGLATPDARLANVVISRGDDAKVHVVEYDLLEREAAFVTWDLTRRLWLHTSGMGKALGLQP